MWNNPIKIDKKIAADLGLSESIIYSYLIDNADNGSCYLDIQQFEKDLPFISKSTINRAINKLKSNNYIKIKQLSATDRFNILNHKNMEGLGIGNKVCEWCGGKSLVLHEHHYPIQKKDGGTETVNICPNCHYEFHHLNLFIEIK